MRDINHRIKIYNDRCKSHLHRRADSKIFLLLSIQILLSTIALALWFLDLLWWRSDTFTALPFLVLIAEITLLPGMLQLSLLREATKDRQLFPETPTRSIRVVLGRSNQLNFRALIDAFAAPRDPFSLADELRNEWKDRRSLEGDIRLAKGVQVGGFFRLPSKSVSAGYLVGIAGLMFTLGVALLQREEVIASLPLSWEIFKAVVILSIAPLVAVVILLPTAWNGLLAFSLNIRERLDDDYLSDRSFFTFIEDLLELHDTSRRRLLFKTTARVYWTTRILTTPVLQLGIVTRQACKSRRIGKLRRKKRQTNL